MTTELYPIYILLEDGQLVPIRLDPILWANRACIKIRGAGVAVDLVGPRKDMTLLLSKCLEVMTIRAAAASVLTISPEQVVAYFESSPILREMADDVKIALFGSKTAKTGLNSDFQLNQDLEQVGDLREPSMADISERLTGSRQYGGSTYTRVKKVYDALQTSTTSRQIEPEEPEAWDLAA